MAVCSHLLVIRMSINRVVYNVHVATEELHVHVGLSRPDMNVGHFSPSWVFSIAAS